MRGEEYGVVVVVVVVVGIKRSATGKRQGSFFRRGSDVCPALV
jgi:hypothetical protein